MWSCATVLGIGLLVAGCSRNQVAQGPATRESDVRAELEVLAHDSLEGRAIATVGAARAARYIAEKMREIGLEPLGDSGYFQKVPVAWQRTPDGGLRPVLVGAPGQYAARAGASQSVNVVALLRGADPQLRDHYVLVDAHYDHEGVGKPVNGDSIYNGADDDASGVVAVLEIARALKAGPPPKRSVIFLATTGEEVGLLGTRWFIDHSPVPFSRIVANLEIEMIGRPDSLAGGPGKGWLTGYERSTMGDFLRDSDVAIVPDPRPSQRFFERSDNIAFARCGIPAHTLSSFSLHSEYHTVDDEVQLVDFAHMTKVIDAAARAARILADGPRIEWKKDGRPGPSPNRPLRCPMT